VTAVLILCGVALGLLGTLTEGRPPAVRLLGAAVAIGGLIVGWVTLADGQLTTLIMAFSVTLVLALVVTELARPLRRRLAKSS
jgi:hypothetical protein